MSWKEWWELQEVLHVAEGVYWDELFTSIDAFLREDKV